MWTVSGRGGCVFALGDLYEFSDVPLERRGDGWDWCAPETLRFWQRDPIFEVFEGGRWLAVTPERVYPRSGLAVFARCLSGHVRASGLCRTASRLTEVGKWKVVVENVVRNASVLGGEQVFGYRQSGVTALLDVSVDCPGDLYTWLPHGKCVVAGVGCSVGPTVIYNDEGVVYDPCS